MLCYAVDEFSAMTRSDNISYENIETTADLFGELLDQTFLIVYNEMVFRQYSLKNYNTNRPRGRLNIEKSYATGVIGKGQINCNVFSFNIDNQLNQAVKAGFLSLLNFGDKNVLS
jgi:5-methylcytosine-specific restriction endonuclease McrBC regulatory subunit McrC